MKEEHHLKQRLKKVSTATIATALFKRGLKNQFIQGVFPLRTVEDNMVGRAYTLRYIPAREDLNTIDVFKNSKHLQRIAVEECPEGYVLVIDSRKDARAASAGSILATRLMKRGVAGIVTDGGFRDMLEIAKLSLPAFHKQPSAPTNLTLHQAIAVNEPIGCGDVAVFPGDYIVGDNDGVIVIPFHITEEIILECEAMEQYEAFVVQQVQKGASIIGLYPLTKPEMAEKYEHYKNQSSPNSLK